MIRRAEEKDIPRMGALLEQVNLVHHYGRPDIFKVGRKYTNDELVAIIHDETKPILVAVDETDFVMGYAFCIYQQHIGSQLMTDIKTLYIDDLCVDENIRGKHVGSRLYDHVCAYAKEIGCKSVTLNVWCGNDSAMAFYQSRGMKPRKIYMETSLEETC